MTRIFEKSKRGMRVRGLWFLLAAMLACTFMIASPLTTKAATSDTWLLQHDLAGLGYLPTTGVDGTEGPITVDATRAFQNDNGLQTDGDAGPLTMTALTNKVKEVQSVVGVDADGVYGQNTVVAVQNYQSRNGLQADGIAGPRTMTSMAITRVVGAKTSPSTSNQHITYRFDCGIVTCSLYFSRSTTRWIANNSQPAQIVADLATIRMPPSIQPVIAAIAAGIELISWKANQAKDKNQCLRIRFTRSVPPAVVGLYSMGNQFCVD